MRDSHQPMVPGLERGLSILGLFAKITDSLTTQEMSQMLDIPLSSTYRIVKVMEQHEFLERDVSEGKYRLGKRLLHLGFIVLNSLDVRQAARPVMHRLAHEIGESVVLMIPRRDYAVCVEQVDGKGPVRPTSIKIGERRHYNCGAVALALLAYLPLEHQNEVLKTPLPKLTEHTLINSEEILARCESIRRSGVSYSNGEVFPGTAGIAAPIFNAFGEVVASIALTGIMERIVGMDQIIIASAQEISKELGWLG